MASTEKLLKGGTLLIHDKDDHVVPTVADLLISDSYISKIAPSIDVGGKQGVEVIDCSGKIISPGFIDTHRHTWQTQLKGQHVDQTLLEYFPCGNFASALYTPEDTFWGQLSGCMESLDAGTTTVVDHAHINVTAEYSLQALRATISSGLRTVFCYSPTLGVNAWSPFSPNFGNTTAEWVMPTFKELAAKAPFGPNGRVKLGFGFDGVGAPGLDVKGFYATLRSMGAHLITSHDAGGPMFGNRTTAWGVLAANGVLGPDIVLSHANHPPPDGISTLDSSGAWISCTPSTELQMGQGEPIGLKHGYAPHSSLGIDCHSNNSASIPLQMNLLLQHARFHRSDELNSDESTKKGGMWARTLLPAHTVEEVFNLGTIRGAAAAGLGKEVGRIAEGYRADLVIFDGESPGMLAAAQRDPVGAVVQHGSVRDVEAVIVDGVFRKESGRLKDVVIEGSEAVGCEGSGKVKDGEKLGWKDVAKEVLRSRERLMHEFKKIDFKAAEEVIMDALRMPRDAMV